MGRSSHPSIESHIADKVLCHDAIMLYIYPFHQYVWVSKAYNQSLHPIHTLYFITPLFKIFQTIYGYRIRRQPRPSVPLVLIDGYMGQMLYFDFLAMLQERRLSIALK